MSDNRRQVEIFTSKQIHRQATISVVEEREQADLHIKTVPVLIGDANYATTAGSLVEPRKIELTGDVVGEAYFDGSQDISIITTAECMNGALTSDDFGSGFAVMNGRINVDLPALIGEEFAVNSNGRLELQEVNINKIYVPENTELIIGEVDDDG